MKRHTCHPHTGNNSWKGCSPASSLPHSTSISYIVEPPVYLLVQGKLLHKQQWRYSPDDIVVSCVVVVSAWWLDKIKAHKINSWIELQIIDNNTNICTNFTTRKYYKWRMIIKSKKLTDYNEFVYCPYSFQVNRTPRILNFFRTRNFCYRAAKLRLCLIHNSIVFGKWAFQRVININIFLDMNQHFVKHFYTF